MATNIRCRASQGNYRNRKDLVRAVWKCENARTESRIRPGVEPILYRSGENLLKGLVHIWRNNDSGTHDQE
jgi:hypothetical protein